LTSLTISSSIYRRRAGLRQALKSLRKTTSSTDDLAIVIKALESFYIFLIDRAFVLSGQLDLDQSGSGCSPKSRSFVAVKLRELRMLSEVVEKILSGASELLAIRIRMKHDSAKMADSDPTSGQVRQLADNMPAHRLAWTLQLLDEPAYACGYCTEVWEPATEEQHLGESAKDTSVA